MKIIVEKVTIVTGVQGARFRPIYIRGHWRQRNGHREYVRPHFRHRKKG